MKVTVPLAKNILVPLGITAAVQTHEDSNILLK